MHPLVQVVVSCHQILNLSHSFYQAIQKHCFEFNIEQRPRQPFMKCESDFSPIRFGRLFLPGYKNGVIQGQCSMHFKRHNCNTSVAGITQCSKIRKQCNFMKSQCMPQMAKIIGYSIFQQRISPKRCLCRHSSSEVLGSFQNFPIILQNESPLRFFISCYIIFLSIECPDFSYSVVVWYSLGKIMGQHQMAYFETFFWNILSTTNSKIGRRGEIS